MEKRIFAICLALVLILLCACQSQEPEPTQTQEAESTGAQRDSIESSPSESEESTEEFVLPEDYPTDTEISFQFVDHTLFSEYWTNGTFRCGSDFQEGDYFIISLCGGNAIYGVSDKPDDFPWVDNRLINNISVKNGQYVKIPLGALLVHSEEIDTDNLQQYGIFLVGRDLPKGDYKITTITDLINNEAAYISNIWGAYQICNGSPFNEPVKCQPLFESQYYLSVEDGQYIIINDAKMVLVGAEPQAASAPEQASATVVYDFNGMSFEVPERWVQMKDDGEYLVFNTEADEKDRLIIHYNIVPAIMKIDTGNGNAVLTKDDLVRYASFLSEGDTTISEDWTIIDSVVCHMMQFTVTRADQADSHGYQAIFPIRETEAYCQIVVIAEQDYSDDFLIVVKSIAPEISKLLDASAETQEPAALSVEQAYIIAMTLTKNDLTKKYDSALKKNELAI